MTFNNVSLPHPTPQQVLQGTVNGSIHATCAITVHPPLPPPVPLPLPPVGVRFLSLCRVHSAHHAPPALDGLIATEHQEEGGPTAKGDQGGGDHMHKRQAV